MHNDDTFVLHWKMRSTDADPKNKQVFVIEHAMCFGDIG